MIITISQKDTVMIEEITGAQLGGYTLTQHLTRGGMSDIYLACKGENEQIYALKLVEQQDEEYYQRFWREVQSLSQLRHAHILHVLDYGEQDGFSYYVTPYIEHGTLKTTIADGPMEVAEAGEILTQAGDALQFMHEAGLVHRDIKSTNILLDETGWVWLADFGLAKEVEASSDLTMTGCLIGTPSYMAPELAEQPASASSDIYALGVVLYEMLTGRPPFIGKTPLEVCWKHASTPPPLPSTFNARISPAIEDVMLHALEKDPRARFATAREMVEAYQQALTCYAVVTYSDEDRFPTFEDIGAMVEPGHSPGLARENVLQGHSLVVAAVIVMLALLFALGSVGLAMELQGHPSVPTSSAAQMIAAPGHTATAPPSTAAPSLSPAVETTAAQMAQQGASGDHKPPKHHKHKDN